MEGAQLPSPLDVIYAASPLQIVQVWAAAECGIERVDRVEGGIS